MKIEFLRRDEKGFSLVELMIVVGIIGVLATLALPRFKQFQAKAKMGEAKNILSHIYTLQQSFSLDNNTFRTFALLGRQASGVLACNPDAGAQAIGFRIDPCVDGANNATAPTPRYGYAATGAASTFLATAATGATDNNLVCPGNAVHTFSINQLNQFGGATLGSVEPQVGVACPQ